MEKNPEKSEAIMAKRAGIPTEEYEQYKDGTRFFTLDQNSRPSVMVKACSSCLMQPNRWPISWSPSASFLKSRT